jgi:dihydrofolate reductase
MGDNDDVMGEALGLRLAESGGLLLGRRSYEDMLAYWNTTDSPFKDALNNAPKYVASNTSDPPSWPNSTPLTGDVPKAVSELKKRPGGDLHIMGSGVLIQSLMPHGLIDEYMLLIHPLVLGSGHKLFQDGSPLTTLRLVESVTTTKGVMIATYRPAESA